MLTCRECQFSLTRRLNEAICCHHPLALVLVCGAQTQKEIALTTNSTAPSGDVLAQIKKHACACVILTGNPSGADYMLELGDEKINGLTLCSGSANCPKSEYSATLFSLAGDVLFQTKSQIYSVVTLSSAMGDVCKAIEQQKPAESNGSRVKPNAPVNKCFRRDFGTARCYNPFLGEKSMTNLAGVVQLLKNEQDRLTRELRGITAALAAFGQTYGKTTTTRKVSASARARMAAAQRARWAKVRGETAVKKTAPKKILSAAVRRKIAAAQRARWAKVKAAKKTT